MDISRNLIIGEGVKHKENILKLLKEGTRVYKIFIICINNNTDNIFEIFESTEMYKPFYKLDSLLVIGIADTKKEAYQMVSGLIKKYYDNNSNKDIKTYFSKIF